MLRIFRTALAGVVFGLSALVAVAVAQTVNLSLQLSQDARGAFGVDTNSNLYIQSNRHLLFSSNSNAQPTVAGTGCAIATGTTDSSGQLTGCTGTTAIVTFANPFLTQPRCLASSSQVTPLGISNATGTVTFTAAAGTSSTWSWVCLSNS